MQVAETIDQDVQNNDVRPNNSSDLHLLRKGNSSGVVLRLHKGSQNLAEFDQGWGRTHSEHVIEGGNNSISIIIIRNSNIVIGSECKLGQRVRE